MAKHDEPIESDQNEALNVENKDKNLRSASRKEAGITKINKEADREKDNKVGSNPSNRKQGAQDPEPAGNETKRLPSYELIQ